MSNPVRISEIEEIAELLVNVRRQRTHYQDGDEWKRWTYCSRFICQYCAKDDYRLTGTQARLEDHLRICRRPELTRFAPKIAGGPF